MLPWLVVIVWFGWQGTLGSFWLALTPKAALGYVTSEPLGYDYKGLIHNGGRFIWRLKLFLLAVVGLVVLVFWEKPLEEADEKVPRGLRLTEIWLFGAALAVGAVRPR